MLLPQHEHDTGRLGVEGRGHVQDCVVHQFMDASVGDGDVGVAKLIDCATSNSGGEERGSGC